MPGAIGMTTMTVVEQSQGKIKALSIDGIAPSAENVELKDLSANSRVFLRHQGRTDASRRTLP